MASESDGADQQPDPWDGWRVYYCEWCDTIQGVWLDGGQGKLTEPIVEGRRLVCRSCHEEQPWPDRWTQYKNVTRRVAHAAE